MEGDLTVDAEAAQYDPPLIVASAFQLASVRSILPHCLVRNRSIEAKLDTLVTTQPLIWVRAPIRMGKRTAIAAWLNQSPVEREIVWIRLPLATAEAVDPIASMFGAVAFVNVNRRQADAQTALSETRAATRLRAIEIIRSRNRQTVVVVELGTRQLARSEVNELAEFALESFPLRIVLIQDEELSSAVMNDMPTADITGGDLALTAEAIRAEWARRDIRLAESVIIRLLGDYHGSPVLVARLLEQLSAHPGQDVDAALASAHAHTVITSAQRLMPEIGHTFVVLLTLVPDIPEWFLAARAPNERITAHFQSLLGRGLLESSITPNGGSSYRLPSSVREIVRSKTLPHYLSNKSAIHNLACEYFVAVGELKLAIQQQLLLDDTGSALNLFCCHWDEYLRVHGLQQARELCASLPLSALLSNLEASAAAWLIHSTLSEIAPIGPYAARVLDAHSSEIDGLSARARLTVRAARILMMLDRDRLESANVIAQEAFSDLKKTTSGESAANGGIYLEFLLAAARTALSRGSLRRSEMLYEEALTLAETAQAPVAQYRALSGHALTRVFNGELAASQRAIDRANALAESSALGLPDATIELTWCQCMIWTNTDDYDKMTTAMTAAEIRAQSDNVWVGVARFFKVRVLLRHGQLAAATSILRTLLGSVLVRRSLPLFRRLISWFLGLALALSNQPGAALEAIKEESDNEDHVPCFAAVRSFAHVARGDPLAALESSRPCLARSHEHAMISLVYVYVARAVALEVLKLTTSAEDAFVVALGMAANAGMKVNVAILASNELTELSERARAQQPWLSPQVLDFDRSAGPKSAERPRAFTKLTTKEREVLQHLVQQSTLAEIAAELFVSENTVKTHAKHLYRKLGVSSRREAADLAMTWTEATRFN
jgi:ATP/maltotriose-dependent transcriptional regulator MalT